ncbi:MAG TPA: hypothetical protein VN645_02170 [Steroidobacteraceae bacterium]|nr:hypothetical protein [Steroidobacteraceae bacterium]
MKLRSVWCALLGLCGAQIAQAAEPELADLYGRLVFDVCVPEAARGAPPPDGKMEFPGFVVRGPDEAGNLATAMQVPAKEPVYMIATADTTLARKVYAYLAASRKSCVVVSSDLPGVQDRVIAAVAGTDDGWTLYMKKDFISIHVGQAHGANIELVNRGPSKPGMAVSTLVMKSDAPLRLRVADAVIGQWVTRMIDACSVAGKARRAITDEEVADYFERTVGKSGQASLTGKSGFPSGLLFTDGSKGKPCQFAGSGGYEETQQIMSALRAQLAERGASPTNKPANVRGGTKVLLPKLADARRSTPGIIVTYDALLDGSMAVISFWAD